MRRFVLAALLALSMAAPGAQAQAQAPAPVASPTRGVAPVHAPPRPAAAATARLDVNAAPADQLATLPGIGPARSKAIVDNRPYEDLQDLVKKKVLGQAVLDKVKAQMALANINTSPAAAMEKTLPGVGDVRSKAIVAGRPYAGPADLVNKGVLTQAQLDRIKDMITY